MNSENILDVLKKITYPIDSNKYINGILLIILLVNTPTFIPQPLLPDILVNELKKYGLLSFIFTLIFSYLLSKDINVSIIVSLLIFALNFLNLKINQDNNLDKKKQNTIIKPIVSTSNNDSNVLNKDYIDIKTKSKHNVHNINDFKFTEDNLKYLNYDINK